MANKKTIGELIEQEVRRQQIPITDFAKKICCQRNNVYDIFKRCKMDIAQLKKISEVLSRNFFKELANDIDLINENEKTEEEIIKNKAVAQFFNVVPDVLKKIGKSAPIVFYKSDSDCEDCQIPDFGLSGYYITFTIGRTLKDILGDCKHLLINTITDNNRNQIEVCKNILSDTVLVNVKLDYKTHDEWRKVIELAFDTYEKFNRR